MPEQLKLKKKKQEARGILSALGLNFWSTLGKQKNREKRKIDKDTSPADRKEIMRNRSNDISGLRQTEIDFLNAELGKETNVAKQALIRMQIKTLEQYRDVMRTFEVKSLAQGRKMVSEARQQVELESKQKVEERMKLVWGDTYPTFERARKLKVDLKDLEFGASKLFLELRKNGGQTFEEAYEMMRDEIGKVETELQTLQIDNSTETFATDILSYKEDLAKEGHIAQVGTVKKNLEEIKLRMTIGKPVFLHGPTGTGKTSLARFAAKELTGKSPEIIYCNPQTREVNIFGRTGIEVQDGQPVTKFDFGPLAKACVNGRVCIFDEFTSLPKEQMSMIKGIMNAKVGDLISIPGNGQVRINQGFQLIFTANLKSDKNLERQDLPPEVANEFSQNNLEIKYSEPEEAWQIFLARIIDSKGDAEFSEYDLLNTVPRLLKAMKIIQDSYNGVLAHDVASKFGLVDAGKVKGLKKLVMNQRDIENILESYKVERKKNKKLSFMEFVDERLRQVLTFGEYREDKELCAKILASQGLLTTITESDLKLPAKTLSVLGHKKADIKSLEASRNVRVVNIKELSELDPFGLRKKQTVNEVATALDLTNVPKVEIQTGTPSNYQDQTKFLEDIYKTKWNHNPQGKVENGTVIQTDISQVNYTSTDRLDTDINKYGQVEFIEQNNSAPDFNTSTPQSIDVMSGQGKKDYEAWRKTNKITTNRYGDVMNYIAQTYGNSHYIPGLDYWQWIQENPTSQQATILKQNSYSFFPGSLFRDRHGTLLVPSLATAGGVLEPRGRWLGGGWRSGTRVVLLPKP